MLRLHNIKLPLSYHSKSLIQAAAKALGVSQSAVERCEISKKSVDARKKNDVCFVVALDVTLKNPQDEKRIAARLTPSVGGLAVPYTPPAVIKLERAPAVRPIVVGFGPAGLFAALTLAEAGACPIVLERGQDVDIRTRDVHAYWSRGAEAFSPSSNVQFGEGGAGTFSDGKLNTGTHDARIGFVLAEFAAHGAPEHITYDAKPHIGTDVLVEVVQNLRREVIDRGGEVRFGHRVTGLSTEDGHIAALTVAGPAGSYTLPARQVILAIGHSARDTFEMLHAQGVPMEPKPFSMGVRIEHPQRQINEHQYGPFADAPGLGAADYKLNVQLPSGGSAYTFCMCPGGRVVAAASEAGGVVTNGMSDHARDGENANAALLVTLNPADFPDKSTLGGMYWQRQIEQAAFRAGGSNYRAPAQLVGDFLEKRPSRALGDVQPTYRPGVTLCDLHKVLPERITAVLEQALPELDKRLHGFARPDAVLTAPETRSSSPVRILRDETRQSYLRGLYPCGEGAGYAGGITSAALDGMLTAEAIINELKG